MPDLEDYVVVGIVVGPAGADATINGVNALTIAAGANVTLTQSGATLTMSVDAVTESQMDAAIDAKVSSVYKAGGSATLATLPELSAANLGLVVNMTESFTTTSDFVEGAGKTYPAGSNVVVALIGSAYLYDVLAGFVDLSDYAKKSEIPTKTSDLTNDSGFLTEHQSLTDYVTKTEQSKTDAAQNQDIADLKSENALLRELISGVDAPVYRTASGNPATFSDGYDNATLKSCVVTIAPTQDGSGDPSLDNVRPIVGYSSVTLTRSGANLADFSGMASDSNLSVRYSADGKSVTFTHLKDGTHSILKIFDLSAFIGRTIKVSVEDIVDGPDNVSDDYTGYIRIRGRESADTTAANAYDYTLYKTSSNGFSKTVTVPANGSYLFMYFSLRMASVAGDVVTFVNPRVEIVPEERAVSFVDADGEALTVYGGSVDVISGTLSVTRAVATLTGTEPFILNSMATAERPLFALTDQTALNALFPDMLRSADVWYVYDRDGLSVCSHFKLERALAARMEIGEYAINASANTSRGLMMSVNPETASTVEAFTAWLAAQYAAGTPVQILYPLATPVTYQLTPVSLTSLSGYNSVSADAGTLSVTYRADTQITLS